MTIRQHPFASIGMALICSVWAQAWANEVDEAGNLVATPREAEMMEKGFLYFPPRVLRKAGATKPPEVQTLETVPAMPTPTVVSEPQAVPVVVAEPAPAPAPPPEPSAIAGDKILQTNPKNRLSLPTLFAKSHAYVGAGTGLTLGLSIPLAQGGSYRIEFSDSFKSPQANQSYGGSAYQTSQEEQHAGVYMDWSPHNDNWFVTGGLTLNNHRIKVQTVADASLSIDYKLPTITPYVGVRYVHKAYNDKGWEGFAEIGMWLGKLNANYTTTSADAAGVQAEVDRIRQSIYRWSVVPKAIVGLNYKY